MIQVGVTIEEIRHFIEVYPQLGGMITGKIVGKGINGINKEYPISKFNKTGEHGKRISIGRSKIVGVSKRRTKSDHGNNSRKSNSTNNNSETMKEEEIRKT
jgi:hypothetical protein